MPWGGVGGVVLSVRFNCWMLLTQKHKPLRRCSCFPSPHWLAPTASNGAGRSRSRWDASGWFLPSLPRWRRGCWDWWGDCSWLVCSGRTRQAWPGICGEGDSGKSKDLKSADTKKTCGYSSRLVDQYLCPGQSHCSEVIMTVNFPCWGRQQVIFWMIPGSFCISLDELPVVVLLGSVCSP